MKIWLVNPPLPQRRLRGIGGVLHNLFYNSPPLGLASIAAVLEAEGHRVAITDCPVESMSIDVAVSAFERVRPDVVGLTATTFCFEQAATLAAKLKARAARVPIVLGGPHLSAFPDLLNDHGQFDLGVLGEGERTMVELVRELDAGRSVRDVPGVLSCHGDELWRAERRPLIEDLDELPFPARHLLPLHRYRPLPNDQRKLPKTSMITSRGCPFSCIFCDKSTFADTYRARSPALLVQEMHHLERRYGIRDIAFVDSTFTPTKARIHAVLEAMEVHPPRASWTASCRADVLDEPTLRRMRSLNCWKVRIAVESGNDEILRRIRKGVTKSGFEATVHAAKRAGLQVKGFFMLGHIGETAETMEETIQFALSLPLDDATVQLNTPLVGTPQYELCQAHGRLVPSQLETSSFFQPAFIPEGMTGTQLLHGLRRFYRRFYLRPTKLLGLAASCRNPSDVRRILRSAPLAFNMMISNRRS